jgi:ureidoglycolate hydrolase
MWERHPYTSQSFVPMGKGNEELEKGGEGMVVVVALNGEGEWLQISELGLSRSLKMSDSS